MWELALRLVVSLAAVVGLLLVLARITQRRMGGGQDDLVRILHRRPLSRTSAVAVVTVGERVLVLGTTEQQVSVLAELDPDEIATTLPAGVVAGPDRPVATGLSVVAPGKHRADVPIAVPTVPAGRGGVPPQPGGPLAGSLLSVQTWRQALTAATRARDAS